MENLTKIIGENLRNIRKQNNLSLDEVSEITGVSKPMLGQIERGISNPTVSTLWKIATGLKVPFSSFMEKKKTIYELIDCENLRPILECQEKMKIFTMFPFNIQNNFEILYIVLEEGCTHNSPKHNLGVEEYIFMIEGDIEVSIGENKMSLSKGKGLKFLAETEHSYKNKTETRAIFLNLIVYHNKE